MKLTGHKTESIYRRYAIVAESDLGEAGAKLSALEFGMRVCSPPRTFLTVSSSLRPWVPSRDIRCQTRTPAAPEADATDLRVRRSKRPEFPVREKVNRAVRSNS